MQVTQAEFARLAGVSRQNVGKLLRRRIIDGAAISGSGRDLRINVDLAKRQMRARRDAGQAISNGARTKVAPVRSRTPPPPLDIDEDLPADAGTDLDEAIKREKLVEIQARNRKGAEDEAARSGRYVLAADARLQANRLAAEMLRVFEGALPDFASDVAARHHTEARDELHALRAVFTRFRARASEIARKTAGSLPREVPDTPTEPDEE